MRGMWCCVVFITQFLEVLWPSPLLLRGKGVQKIMGGPVETLALAISFRMVGRASGFLDTVHLAEFSDYLRFKAPALVRVDSFGTPYTRNQSRTKALTTVLARWSLVGTATVNLVKTSVISLPSCSLLCCTKVVLAFAVYCAVQRWF